jgi:hypothetical protein
VSRLSGFKKIAGEMLTMMPIMALAADREDPRFG